MTLNCTYVLCTSVGLSVDCGVKIPEKGSERLAISLDLAKAVDTSQEITGRFLRHGVKIPEQGSERHAISPDLHVATAVGTSQGITGGFLRHGVKIPEQGSERHAILDT